MQWQVRNMMLGLWGLIIMDFSIPYVTVDCINTFIYYFNFLHCKLEICQIFDMCNFATIILYNVNV